LIRHLLAENSLLRQPPAVKRGTDPDWL
jgi:hypothetical protein